MSCISAGIMCDDPEIDYTLIYGHTPTVNYQDDRPPKIYHAQNRICIDCACGYIDPPGTPESERINGRLACLRLDDMKEYYVE